LCVIAQLALLLKNAYLQEHGRGQAHILYNHCHCSFYDQPDPGIQIRSQTHDFKSVTGELFFLFFSHGNNNIHRSFTIYSLCAPLVPIGQSALFIDDAFFLVVL
jgi:hypothetical protein